MIPESAKVGGITALVRPAGTLKFVLITPARNEGAFIEQTINAVTQQTVLPARWVIVSDGSTDATDTIVKKYAAIHSWLELVVLPQRTERHFAGKAHAFHKGHERVAALEYDVIGCLDADITFDPEHFDFLLKKFVADPRLGVAGSPFREGTVQYDYRFSRKEHVSGACQLFRRECFQAIGGYTPLKGGGIDLVAVVSARMKGWKTETFPERFCLHHRPMGSAKHSVVKANFRSGYGDYLLGVHPVWQLLRSVYQMSRKPFLVGGVMLLAGYSWAILRQPARPVSNEFVEFRRTEQVRWLKEYSRRLVPGLMAHH